MLFEWIAPLPQWVAPALLVLAVLSSVGGVLYALMQHELKRLLAFHSVENIGIIVLGLGASLLAADAGHRTLAAVAFGAAMLHILNHALFKSLLFLCAGSFQHRIGSLDLDRLGGLLRTMPVTGAAFLAGSMAIAGVPPFNGFASEWLTLQSLAQLALRTGSTGIVLGALGAGALAATAALAVYCFVKVVGLVLLGPHRQRSVAHATEVPATMAAPVALLAILCLAIGVAPGIVLARLGDLSPYGALPDGAARWAVAIPGSGTFVPAAIGGVLIAVVVVLQRVRCRAGVAAPAPMWMCGQRFHPRLAWTSGGFTKSLRLVLESVLRPRRDVAVERSGAEVQSIRHEVEVTHLFDDLLYRPMLAGAVHGSRFVRRMQSGSLRAYLAYLLVALAVVLAVVRIGAG